MRKGFTMLEIVLVVAIIAILAGIVAPRLVSRLPKAQIASTKANLSGLRSALTAYRADKGKYPGTSTLANDLKGGGYIKAVPKCDVCTCADTAKATFATGMLNSQGTITSATGTTGWIYACSAAMGGASPSTCDIFVNQSGNDVDNISYLTY